MVSVKLLSLCCFLPDFVCPSKLLTQCKSLHLLRITAAKASIITVSISSPTTVGFLFKGEESLSRFVQEEEPAQRDTQPVLLPVAGEGSVLFIFVFCLGCPACWTVTLAACELRNCSSQLSGRCTTC